MATSYQEAVEKTIIASEQLNQIVNGTATTEIIVEDGSKIPSVRKALVDNFYFKDPLPWQQGQPETVFNQLRKFNDGTIWYAPTATLSNVVVMGVTPVGDPLWEVYSLDAIPKLTPQIRESLRRSYAEIGYTLVSGSFETGGTLNNASEVLLQKSSGKAFSWGGSFPVTVIPNTDPLAQGSGFVDLSGVLLRSQLSSSIGATLVKTLNGVTVQDAIGKVLPFFTKNGGQLSDLKSSLASPLSQTVGIVFIGDSITWGMTADGSGSLTPRTGQLSDQRNLASARSFANIVRENLASQYMPSSNLEIGSWPGSSGGDARFLYSYSNPANIALLDPSVSFVGQWVDGYDSSSTVGTYKTANPNITGSGEYSMTFTMEGLFFDLVFAAYTKGAKYRVYVDGVQVGGDYPTDNTVLGVPVQFGYKRRHFIGGQNRKATVKIELVNDYPNYYILRLEAISIAKQLRFINQGIIGISSKQVIERVLPTGIEDVVNYAIVQIGTNDRNMPYYAGQPSNIASLRKNLCSIVDELVLKGIKPILMCANATTDTGTYFQMKDVRDAVASVSELKNVDFIDNFLATSQYTLSTILADGLHPNTQGHTIMADNIINSIKIG